MRYLMIVQYNGKPFNGFQKQTNGNTVQNKLEDAIKIITKESVICVGSGRTDAMVSAYFQPVHFDINTKLNVQKFQNSMNGILPDEIKVLSVCENNLHARFDAKSKTYCYKMYVSNVEMPLCDYALKISPSLDFKSMKKFVKLLKGTHNFEGFKASGSETESSIRTIFKAKLNQHGKFLTFEITGNGFLYKMVRNIVGTMLKIGEGKLDLKKLKSTLFSTYKCTHTAQPQFLYLKNVKY